MSIRTKNINVSVAQRYSDKVEFRFFNDQLFICKVEDNGQILHGATLTVDSLPAAAIYGTSGNPESFVLSSEVSLNVDFSSLTPAEQTQLEDALEASVLAGINIEGAIVLIEAMTSP